MHVKSLHYLDLFLFRAIQIFWWWNPLVWIARTELGLLHEYEANKSEARKERRTPNKCAFLAFIEARK